MGNVSIDIGEYRITSDSHGWQLARKTVAKSGKKEGEEMLVERRYFPTLQSLLCSTQDVWMRESGAESIQELLDAVTAFREELDELFYMELGRS